MRESILLPISTFHHFLSQYTSQRTNFLLANNYHPRECGGPSSPPRVFHHTLSQHTSQRLDILLAQRVIINPNIIQQTNRPI